MRTINYFLVIAALFFSLVQGMGLPDSPRFCPKPSPTCSHRAEQDADMKRLAEAEQLIDQARTILEECAKKTSENGTPTRVAQIAKFELGKIVQATDKKQAKKLFKSVSESQLLGGLAYKELDAMSKPKVLSQSAKNN